MPKKCVGILGLLICVLSVVASGCQSVEQIPKPAINLTANDGDRLIFDMFHTKGVEYAPYSKQTQDNLFYLSNKFGK